MRHNSLNNLAYYQLQSGWISRNTQFPIKQSIESDNPTSLRGCQICRIGISFMNEYHASFSSRILRSVSFWYFYLDRKIHVYEQRFASVWFQNLEPLCAQKCFYHQHKREENIFKVKIQVPASTEGLNWSGQKPNFVFRLWK